MTSKFPITPPPELVQQWFGEFFGCTVSGELSDSERFLATRAAQWGADQELEACCEWMESCRKWLGKDHPYTSNDLPAARRPKSLSMTDDEIDALVVCIQALPAPTADNYALDSIDKGRAMVRRALERLQKLEGGNG